MKSFLKNDEADVKMIGAVVGILITLIIAVLVFYNIAAGIDAEAVDDDLWHEGYSPASNATNDTLDQAATFFQIAPTTG